MAHLSWSDLPLAERWAKWAVWKRSNSSSLSLCVGEGWPQNGPWGLSVIVRGLRLMKYFLSGLIPHLTFLIFDLLMVIAHYAGFKGQIHKMVLPLLIEPSSRNLVQKPVIARVTSAWSLLGAHRCDGSFPKEHLSSWTLRKISLPEVLIEKNRQTNKQTIDDFLSRVFSHFLIRRKKRGNYNNTDRQVVDIYHSFYHSILIWITCLLIHKPKAN